MICLAGLPASGKSTFASKLKKTLESKFNRLVVKIIDPDIIRQNISSGNFDYRLEPKVREYYLTETRKELQLGMIVISDNLNYYSSMRHDLKKLTENFELKFFIIHISTPYNVCLQWNKKRDQLLQLDTLLFQNWPEVRAICLKVREPQFYVDLIRKTGFPLTLKSLSVSEDEFMTAALTSRTIRERITILDIAAQAGVLEKAAEEALALLQ